MSGEVGGLGMVEMTIYRSTDSRGEEWDLVEPDDVPLWIKHNPDVIARFKAGHGAQAPSEDQWYVGIPTVGQPESRIVGLPWRK